MNLTTLTACTARRSSASENKISTFLSAIGFHINVIEAKGQVQKIVRNFLFDYNSQFVTAIDGNWKQSRVESYAFWPSDPIIITALNKNNARMRFDDIF